MRKQTGRQFFANPGPTNIPESVLRAMNQHSIDFHDEGFLAVYDECVEGLKRVLRTSQEVFIYTSSGHGAWEATLVNLLSPGDVVLIPESGYFSEAWSAMSRGLGLRVQSVPADWRRGVDLNTLGAALEADREHKIRAVCIVHNETSTGVTLPLGEIRGVVDAARHPALLLADTISSLGSIDFRMDEWGVDGVVGGSQKGLMLSTGLGFTGVSAKGMAAHKTSKLPKHYFNWSNMVGRRHRSFVGTVPTAPFYGMREALRILEEEGLDHVLARHHRLAQAVRACVTRWAGNHGPQIYCNDPSRQSDSVTAVLMPEGHDAEAVRKVALEKSNVSLGGGLGKLDGRVFRIGHMGDLNEPMVLGTLGAVELALRRRHVPHGAGGVEAAMDRLAEPAAG